MLNQSLYATTYYLPTIIGACCSTWLFFWQLNPNFHSYANNSKTAGRRELKFLHNVGIH